MSLVQVKNLHKFYGATPVLRDAGLIIGPGEKWGLIGKNGSGKTTLIRVLTGEEDYDQGDIYWTQNCRIGYLRQDPRFRRDYSIYQELRGIFTDLDEIQGKLTELEEKMNACPPASDELNELVEEYHRLNDEFEEKGGYQIEGRIQGVLRGLGFLRERWGDPAASLSGGEQTRLALARLLLTPWDILFLDEPTNYLDLTAIEWLEEFLIDFKGAILLVSHDRFFLDRVVTGILELDFQKIHRFKGNYTDYRRQKEQQTQAALKAYQEKERQLAKQEKFIREASMEKKRQAHSVEKRLSSLERMPRPVQDHKTMKLEFKKRQASSRQVLEFENIYKSFGAKTLLNNVSFRLEAGQKVGLIGPNGSGKTTLLKLILGLEQPDQGWVKLGYEVQPGYFSQLYNETELNGTPFSQIMEVTELDNTGVRTLLGRFLFSGEDVFKSVADLSGGERRRLGLIKLMLSRANFLILDEPTNHLDLDSIEAIEKALLSFDGTVLIVSHDRYFLKKIVDRFLAIIDYKLQPFVNYEDYLNWRKEIELLRKDPAKVKNESQLRREQNKDLQREIRRKQRILNEVETDINVMEERKSELTLLLNDPANHTDYKKSLELSQDLSEIEFKLGKLYQKWEQLQEELAESL